MVEVRQAQIFSDWLKGLADGRVRGKIAARLDRLSPANPGRVARLGEGGSELRIHFGPVYRVYFVARGGAVLILLCGGDKSNQAKDIKMAKRLARDLEK